MQEKVFMFFNPHFILGGVDTYFYRMICWLRNSNYRTYLLLPQKAAIDKEFLENVNKTGTTVLQCIERYKISNEVMPTACKLDIEKNTEVVFITTRIPDYVVAQKIANTNKHLKFTFINYMLHVHAFICPSVERKDTSLQNYLFFQLRYRYYRRILNKGTIVFMDDICGNVFSDFYHVNLKNMKIIPLGIDVGEYHKQERKKEDKFTILTVTRFEFPYKGYVLGLVQQFAELCNKHENIKLVIIGWGADETKLLETIKKYPESIRKKIQMIGPVEYDELKKYILEANVYVGMGTTLIDAGKLGIPAIAVDFFTEECYSNDLLCNNPEVVSTRKRNKTSKFIEQIINMDTNTYEQCSYKTYKMVKDYFDINQVMNFFSSTNFEDKQYQMSGLEIWLHKIVNKAIYNCFHRNEDNRAWVDIGDGD